MNKLNELKSTQWKIPSNGPSCSNQTRRRPPDELDDRECLICMVEMISFQGTVKCFSCSRRLHNDCATRWLKEKSTCPACYDPMLDPNEYPPLS
uniref:RING-type domain-containing protein n=1 Tax=Caenorhabditis tropicalis TaxID=1561998 RepID=A0A1I7TYR3_9PELO